MKVNTIETIWKALNKIKIIVYIIVGFTLVCFSCALKKYSPAIYNVPSDTRSIQEAIERSHPGDTIIILPGIYILKEKNIIIPDKSITIKGLEGAHKTIIKGRYGQPVVIFAQNSHAILRGVTITSEKQDKDQEPSLYGGGIVCDTDSAPTISECIISGNNAIFGGGVYCSSSSHPRFIDCLISHNSAIECGGGVCVFEAAVHITSSKIIHNRAESSGGGIFCYKDTSYVHNTLVTHNSTEFIAGGACCIESAIKIINTTFALNKSELSGGIYGLGGDIRLTNLIVWGNGEDLLLEDFSLDSRPRYSTIGDGGFSGINGNISANPLFRDPNKEDFHLDPNSPCIDAGEPIEKFNDQDGSRNDMGAFGGPEAYTEPKERKF
ncbi:MAG: right-handed parallel beta-helix repeat-containing protein [bacterium]